VPRQHGEIHMPYLKKFSQVVFLLKSSTVRTISQGCTLVALFES